MQKRKVPAPLQEIWKEIRRTQTFLCHLPKIPKSRALFSPLFHVYLRIEGRGELCKHPSPSCEHRGRPSPRHAGVPEITPIPEIQLQLQSSSSLGRVPLHLPEGQTRPGWGLWESSCPTAGRSPSRPAKTRFSPQTSAEHVQGERFEMFIKWPSLAAKQSESHSAAKSQQHGGARAAQIGRYLTVSKQGKLLFFLFPKSWWCQSHISHMPHTAALPLKLLHCKEKSLS